MFLALAIAIVTVSLAIKGNYKYYWIAAIGIYIFSFLAGFSIGQLTIGLTFIPLSLAIGHTFGWLKTRVHRVLFVSLGVLIGAITILFVDDAWLFFPFWFLF
jgi:hypothetical protein